MSSKLIRFGQLIGFRPAKIKTICCAAILTFFLSAESLAQLAAVDTSQVNRPLMNAISYYHNVVGEQSGLYTGLRHEPYLSGISGSAYFQTDQWQQGSVVFDQVVYRNIPMLYDVVRDELVILSPGKQVGINLVSNRIDRFFLFGHTFINVTANRSINGFYDLLRNGKTAVLVKRKKIIQENTSGKDILRRFLSEDKYYLRKGDEYFAIRSMKNILDALNDRRNEIKLLMKNRKLDMKTDPESTLLEIAAHYDKLNASI